MTIRGVHHVAVATRDMEPMLMFYRDVLGFQVVADYRWAPGNSVADAVTGLADCAARHVMFVMGNAYVELFQFESPLPAAGDPCRRVCDPGFTHFALDVTDIDAEYARLVAAGMLFHTRPRTVFDGVRATYGRDPDGNVIELQEVLDPRHRIALAPFQVRPVPGPYTG